MYTFDKSIPNYKKNRLSTLSLALGQKAKNNTVAPISTRAVRGYNDHHIYLKLKVMLKNNSIKGIVPPKTIIAEPKI